MMNKIIVNKNIIKSEIDNVLIEDNKIFFKESGNYELVYTTDSNIKLTFIVSNVNIVLNEVSFDNEFDIENKYIIDNGSLVVNKFYNNKQVLEKIDIDLLSEGSRIDYNFVNICKLRENYLININHNCKNTISNINNRSIAFKNSDLTFIINSKVLKDSKNSVLDQNTRIVTMGECNTKIEPNMFIDLDDVEARHGSVIGTFKKDQVFYLMSKGISYSDSMKLLIKGYIFSNIDVSVDTRVRILEIIDTYWR